MSCTAEACAFLEVPNGGGTCGGVADMDGVPSAVKGGGVGVGENLDLWGEKSSLRVGDCDGEDSEGSVLGSTAASIV